MAFLICGEKKCASHLDEEADLTASHSVCLSVEKKSTEREQGGVDGIGQEEGS